MASTMRASPARSVPSLASRRKRSMYNRECSALFSVTHRVALFTLTP